MRWSLGVLCCVLAAASGYILRLGGPTMQPRFATAEWLNRQKMILELFENVCEDSKNPMIIRMANEFSLDYALAKYSLTDLVTNFRNLYEGKGLLPKGEVVSEYNKDHLEELRLMYNLLYYANDFDIFYNTAAWARQNVNCGIFVDALYAAVIHRKDTEKIGVPAPYEILPHYFVRRDAIAKAILLFKNNDTPLEEIDGVHSEGNVYTIDANYTGAFIDNEEDSKVSYFLEDIGLNTYYYFMHLRNAHWLDRVNDGTDRKGEYWYYIIRQMNARYNLERVTNGLKEIEDLSWRTTIDTAYDPMLMYSNGKFFPARPNGFTIDSDDATYLIDFENHISSMVQQMGNMNKTYLMNTIFDLLSSEDTNYDWTARRALSSTGDESRMPSALEHYATTLRDPVYWRLNKRLLNAFNVALKVLQPYAHNQLYFPGVEIMDIQVKKMQTYFDYFQFDVTNSVTTNAVDNLIHVNIGQPRLNHKPFSIMINVASLVAQKAIVKIFIGPKFNLADIGLIKDTLKQLDSFEYNLNIGMNKIVRKSDQINNIAGDYLSLRALLKRVEAAELGLEPLYFTNIESIIGFPSRLILPKGTADGFPLQLYVIIAPFVITQTDGAIEREFNTEILSYGYPFDRPIEDPKLFDLSNTMIKDILITHKGDDKVYNYGGEGASKKWYSTGAGRPAYDPDQKPTYGKNTEYKKFDYTAKKGNYEGKKFDYTAKKGNYKDEQTYYSKNSENVFTEPAMSTDEPIQLNVLPIEDITTTETITEKDQISEILDNSKTTETTEDQESILPKVNEILDEEKINYSEELNKENIRPLLRSSPYDYTAKKEKAIKKYTDKKEKQEQKSIKIEAKKNNTANKVQTPNVDSITPITEIYALPIDTIAVRNEIIADPDKSKIMDSQDFKDIKTKDWYPILNSGPYDYMTKKEKRVNESIAKKDKAIDKHETKQLKYQTKYNRTVTVAPIVEPVMRVLPTDDSQTPNVDATATKVLPVDNIVVRDEIIADSDKSKISMESDSSESSEELDDTKNKINNMIQKQTKDSKDIKTKDWHPILRSGPYDYMTKKEKRVNESIAKKDKAIDKHETKQLKYQTKYNRTVTVAPIVEPVMRVLPTDDSKTPNVDATATKVLPVDNIVVRDEIIADSDKSKISMESDSSESSEELDDTKNKINNMIQKQTKDSKDIKTKDWHPILRSGPYDYMTKKEKRVKESIAKKEKAIDKHETKQLKYQTKYNRTVTTEAPTVETEMEVLPVDDVITSGKLIPSKKTFKKQYDIMGTDNYEDLNQKFNKEVISSSLEDSDSTEAVKKYYTTRPNKGFQPIVQPVDDRIRYVDEIDYMKPLHLDDYITWIGLHHVDEEEEEPVYY